MVPHPAGRRDRRPEPQASEAKLYLPVLQGPGRQGATGRWIVVPLSFTTRAT